ncbi:MAG: hypothetical protein IJD57_04640 [Candidatus Gastranaerophilales bacterium]|nr:hypothetical protein [Candidatus Gastranaerophilales bacterium]
MKKIYLLLIAIFIFTSASYAVHFGTYKPEEEYGLIDGFKWNFFNREKGQPLVQLKSETPEEIERLEREKDKPKPQQDDVQLYKFMLDNIVVY